MSDEKQRYIQSLRDEMDDYLQSVVGLHAFAASCCWDETTRSIRPDSIYCVPRRMSTAPAKKASGKTLTPDGVIQVSGEYGVIAEMKKHFPVKNTWAPFEQANRYSEPLLGWWTPKQTIPRHDVVLLTQVASATDAVDAYLEWTAAGNKFSAPFAIIEFGNMIEGQEWLLLRRVHGSLSDRTHDEALRRGKRLPPNRMATVFAAAKFMESEPPILHMLLLVYTYALPLMVSEHDFELASGGKIPVAKASTAAVCKKLQEQFSPRSKDPRSFVLPKAQWVRKALDTLVALDLAAKPSAGSDEYRIPMRKPPRKDVFQMFAERLYRHEKKLRTQKNEDQPSLFGENPQ